MPRLPVSFDGSRLREWAGFVELFRPLYMFLVGVGMFVFGFVYGEVVLPHFRVGPFSTGVLLPYMFGLFGGPVVCMAAVLRGVVLLFVSGRMFRGMFRCCW